MGVYNPKKKMPTSCYMCWDSLYCEYKIKNPVKMAQGRADDCPLIEIPTPHGRMIDADALFKAMGLDTVKEIMLQNWKCTTAWGVPIIEAEEK